MKTVIVLLLFFMGVGIFARAYNGWVRLLLIAVIGVVILYLSIS